MVKKTFEITTGCVDNDGDIILPTAIKMPEKGLKILDHFDYSKPIGIVTELKRVGNSCVATGMFNEDPTGLYPAIGFDVIKSHKNAHSGITFDEIRLWSVGITPAPNADPKIKPIQ